jgi:2,3-bisphosphoglycerate-independent phosphoglycerate mutase
MLPRPVTLCILDGIGWGRRDVETDAVFAADTPTLDRWTSGGAAWTLLKAHGTAVGLPSDKDMGNSEVGHNAMGAGRVFDQGAKLVDAAIESGRIFESEAWKRAVSARTIHFLGLLSDGNVHSHVRHLDALLDRAAADGVSRIRVHVLTDGRDVPGRSALTWVRPLEEKLRRMNDAAIATGGGRMVVTMDRYEAEWGMVERGWHLHVGGEGRRFPSASEAIETLYAEDPKADDQWLPPFVVGDYAGMRDGDAVILFNFRGDRAIEISRAFEEETFPAFPRSPHPAVSFAGMMEYDGDTHVPKHFLVSPPQISGTVGEALAASGKKVLALSETQKFGHVTYFFNGNRSARLPGETWKEIPSDQGPFDRAPEMKAREVCEAACDAIVSGEFDHVRINFANGDMVGHTGNFAATVTAVEVLDRCLADLEAATLAAGGVLLVTADHGNADEMVELEKGKVAIADGRAKPKTSHTLSPVPLVLVDPTGAWRLQGKEGVVSGELAQIGASVLTLCGVAVPTNFLPSLVVPR